MGNNFPSCLPHRPLFRYSASQQSLVFSAAFHNLFFCFLPYTDAQSSCRLAFLEPHHLLLSFSFSIFTTAKNGRAKREERNLPQLRKEKVFLRDFFLHRHATRHESEWVWPARNSWSDESTRDGERRMNSNSQHTKGGKSRLAAHFWMKFESKFATIVDNDDSHSGGSSRNFVENPLSISCRWFSSDETLCGDPFLLLISVFRFSSFSRLHRIALHTAVDCP